MDITSFQKRNGLECSGDFGDNVPGPFQYSGWKQGTCFIESLQINIAQGVYFRELSFQQANGFLTICTSLVVFASKKFYAVYVNQR